MNIITLRRKLWVYRQIHKLNELDQSIIDSGWGANITECAHKLYDVNDVWLKLLSLPPKSFERVLRLSILFLIYHDKTISISGKKLQGLHRLFTKYELNLVKLNNKLVEINTNEYSLSVVPSVFFEVNDVVSQVSLALITKVYGKNKDLALNERYRLRFSPHLLVDTTIVTYVNSFTIESLEQILITALNLIMPNL